MVDMGSLTLDALDSVSDIDSQPESVVYDTLGPPTVPPPATVAWMTRYVSTGKPYTPSYMSPGIVPLTSHIAPAAYNFVNDTVSLDSLLIANGADTVQSSSGTSTATCAIVPVYVIIIVERKTLHSNNFGSTPEISTTGVNNKLRYCGEHSASIVLSWCTL